MGSDIALRVEERTGVLTKTAVVCHGRRHGKDGQTAVGTGPAGGDLAPRERNCDHETARKPIVKPPPVRLSNATVAGSRSRPTVSLRWIAISLGEES